MVDRARYLGNMIENGSARRNVEQRIAAAKAGFQAMYGIWGKRGIAGDLIRELFRSMVQGAILSGMDAEVPSEGDIRRMESIQCTLARRAMGSEGSYESHRGRRQLIDDQVRNMMGISTVKSELRARRIKWWQAVMDAPEENKQMLAALFGTMEREVREGKVLGPTPWVWQLTRDLEEYGAITQQWMLPWGEITHHAG